MFSFDWEDENKNTPLSLPSKPKTVYRASPLTHSNSPFPMGPSFLPKYRSVLPQQPLQSGFGSSSTYDFNGEVFPMSKSGNSFHSSLKSSAMVEKMNQSNSIVAPTFNGTVDWKHSFCSDSSTIIVLEKMKNYCYNKNILDCFVSREKFEIEGRYFSSKNDLAEFVIRVYNFSQSSPQSQTLVQINCLSGCRITFLKFVNELTIGMNEIGVVAFTEISIKPDTFSQTFQLPTSNFSQLSFDVEYFIELIEMMETGYRDECRTSASNLANKSQQSQMIKELEKIPNIVNRLFAVCSESPDVFLVRCILITLINGWQTSNIIRSQENKTQIQKTLTNLKSRWSSTQTPFGVVEIHKSIEVVTQVDKALEIFVTA